jgi:CHAT domain-containing protein
MLAGDGIILSGERATESEFKSQPLERFRVMHFAVHGLTSTKFPDRSALVFRPDPTKQEDGLLQAKRDRELARSCRAGHAFGL